MYGDPLDKVPDGYTKFDDSYYSFDITIPAFIGQAYIHTYGQKCYINIALSAC